MKDSEFIALLNLYLDHEISTADAARLEAEVQSNPGRRRIYQQYCRMQKACKVIAADFQTDTETPADRKTVPFNSAAVSARQLDRKGILYTAGTFAAVAACIAIIFVGQSRQANDAAAANVATVQPAVAPAVTPTATIPNPDAAFVASNSSARHGLVVIPPRSIVRDPLLLTGTQAEAVLAAAVQQANSQLAWLESVQLAPLPEHKPAELHFAASLRSEGRPLGQRATSAGREEGEEQVILRWVK
jgi:hypothetical protein